MPIRRIRMIAFLTLAVLASGCSCTNCSCKCLFDNVNFKSGYICNLISTLQEDRGVDKGKIEELVKETKSVSNRFDEKAIQKAAMNISILEKAVDELRNKSKAVSNRVQELKENTSNRFNTTAEKRNRLRAEMEEAVREFGQQRDAHAKRLEDLERESAEAQLKWQDQENKNRNLEQEIAAKSEEERRRTLEVKKELVKQVEEAEKQTKESETKILERLRESEGRLRETDRFIEEQIQEVNKAVAELSRTVQKAMISLTAQEMKSDKLEAKMKKVKKTTSSLLNSQSELKKEIRTNISFSVERLKTDIEDRLVELKHLGGNLTTKINQIEESQLMLEQELSKCAPIANLSALDRAVREHANESIFEHQSLRFEMFSRMTELQEQCAARSDVARVNQTVTFLGTNLQETRKQLKEVREAVLKPNCKDTLPKGTCKVSVEKQLCSKEITKTRCCASCFKAGQSLPPSG